MSILDLHFLNWNILLNAETDFENIGEGMRKKNFILEMLASCYHLKFSKSTLSETSESSRFRKKSTRLEYNVHDVFGNLFSRNPDASPTLAALWIMETID